MMCPGEEKWSWLPFEGMVVSIAIRWKCVLDQKIDALVAAVAAL